MKAMVDGQLVADSNDVIECKGYQYFPPDSVRVDWLERVEKTADDRACPHGVQFYDVVVGGRRHNRAAWCYEAPRPEMRQVGGRFGFACNLIDLPRVTNRYMLVPVALGAHGSDSKVPRISGSTGFHLIGRRRRDQVRRFVEPRSSFPSTSRPALLLSPGSVRVSQ